MNDFAVAIIVGLIGFAVVVGIAATILRVWF